MGSAVSYFSVKYLASAYFLCFAFFAGTVISILLKKKALELYLSIGALFFCGVVLFLIIGFSGNLPVFYPFESFMSVVFLLACLGIFLGTGSSYFPTKRLWIWIEILILMGMILFFSKEPRTHQFYQGNIYVMLFHGLRVAGLSLVLFASAQFMGNPALYRSNPTNRSDNHFARNMLLLSTVFFLAGEYAGIIWCQQGWGDFWMWNEGFFQSTIIVLFLMLVFHVPGKARMQENYRVLLGAICGPAILALFIIRSWI